MLSKRSLILLGILGVTLLYLIVVQFRTYSPQTQPSAPIQTQKRQPSQSVLSFSPDPSVLQNASASSIDVMIKSGQNEVTAVQLELSYDPKVLTNVDIQPGTFLRNPIVLLKTIDKVKGRISLAYGIQPNGQPQRGKGILATITFRTANINQSTQISFLPRTLVTAQGETESVLKTAKDGTIVTSK